MIFNVKQQVNELKVQCLVLNRFKRLLSKQVGFLMQLR